MTDEEKDMYADLVLYAEKQYKFIEELKKHNLSLEEHLLRSDKAWKFMAVAWIILTGYQLWRYTTS